MSETRARRRIRKAVESRGYGVKSIEWEPVYYGGEMDGACGGWALTTDRPHVPNTYPGDDLYGFTVEMMLAEIDEWLRPAEPCACDQGIRWGDRPRSPNRPLKGEPHRTLHEPDCRWHIAYRLPWWTQDGAR
jgi:hypothetical protein